MNDCIFCKIVSGEIPSCLIYENKEFKVILDKFPSSVGHVLIITKKHYSNIFEIDPEEAGRLFTLAVRVSAVMKKAMGFDGVNILQNNGEEAGQTIHHFHLHIIPRYKNDNVSIGWETLNPSEDELNNMCNKLSDLLR